MYVFGLLDEIAVPGENLSRHKEIMQIPQKKTLASH